MNPLVPEIKSLYDQQKPGNLITGHFLGGEGGEGHNYQGRIKKPPTGLYRNEHNWPKHRLCRKEIWTSPFARQHIVFGAEGVRPPKIHSHVHEELPLDPISWLINPLYNSSYLFMTNNWFNVCIFCLLCSHPKCVLWWSFSWQFEVDLISSDSGSVAYF